jgi:hypothetical protein
LDGNASHLLYSTFFGGSNDDWGHAIALSPAGDVFVAGNTASIDFPVRNALQPNGGGNSGGSDAFLATFAPGSIQPKFSSYLGGNGDDQASAVALDAFGNLYVVGNTSSTDFPQIQPWMKSNLQGPSDAFIAVMKPDFQLAVSPAANTVTAGATASYTVTLTPDSGFAGTVLLSCTGIPSEARFSFQPSSVELNGAVATSTLSITTQAPATADGALWPVLFLLSCVAIAAISHPRRWRRLEVAGATILLLGCGGGAGTASNPVQPLDPGTPKGTYTIVVSANATHSQSAKVTLVVE